MRSWLTDVWVNIWDAYNSTHTKQQEVFHISTDTQKTDSVDKHQQVLNKKMYIIYGQKSLGGGFLKKHRKFGEDFQFDDHIFQMGWFNHQSTQVFFPVWDGFFSWHSWPTHVFL